MHDISVTHVWEDNITGRDEHYENSYNSGRIGFLFY